MAAEGPTTGDAALCIACYFDELDHRSEAGFDPQRSLPSDATELVEPAGLLLLARLRGEPVGCGALKFQGDGRRYRSRDRAPP